MDKADRHPNFKQHGKHIKLVAHGNPHRLEDARVITRFIEEVVRATGMMLLGQPHVYDVPIDVSKVGKEPFEDEGGVTSIAVGAHSLVGIGVLSTSHCSIHTWPARAHFVMDVYSCRDFDAAVIERLAFEVLGTEGGYVYDFSNALRFDDTELGNARAFGAEKALIGAKAKF